METNNPTVTLKSPEEAIGRSFLMPPAANGERLRAKVTQLVGEYQDLKASDPALIKFRCLVNDKYEDIVSYNQIMDFIESDDTWDGVWKFQEILDHYGPIANTEKNRNHSDPKKRHRGSSYNMLVRWTTGEQTWEPYMSTERDEDGRRIGLWYDDPVTVAIYVDQKGLEGKAGFNHKALRSIIKTQKRLLRHVNQAKLHSFRHKPIYMYGFQVPRNHAQAMELDEANKNNLWKRAEELELAQVDEYETFLDKGRGYIPGPSYKKIRVHMVYAVKHDGRHKAQLVAGGHLTDTPIDSVYSSVVSLRGIRILTFLAELNDMEIWATDIGNAYLESYTQEKVYIIAGPEFGEREGHTLIIVRALYGLRTSGLRWHERLADVLRNEGFFLSKAETDIWMRDKGDHYEYIAVYVDDLLICSRQPQPIIELLENKHMFKLKGTGEISFHLGCDYFRDENGNLCYAPLKYIEKSMACYERIFGRKPKQYKSPLEKNDHPELDDSDLLDLDNTKIYQSLIGALQWTIQIGRFDIATATMTLSRFRAAPRQGHLDRVRRIYGFLSKFRHATIRIRTDEPDLSAIDDKVYNWEYTCYAGAEEQIPDDVPKPLGKRVISSAYKDANLHHDLLSGKAVTGILHFLNKTPIDWYSKLQSTVETATFGSEYVSARTCVEQLIDLRTTLRYLGVPVHGPSIMFGDNETVVNTASTPHGKLHKRHNALSFHKVRSAIAAKICRFFHIAGKTNPADILSKHWDYTSVWPMLQPILFWKFQSVESAEDKAEQTETLEGSVTQQKS